MQVSPVFLSPCQQSEDTIGGKVFPGGRSCLESEGWGWEGSGRRSCRYVCEKEKETGAPLLLWEGCGMLHLENDCFLDNLPQKTSGWGGPWTSSLSCGTGAMQLAAGASGARGGLWTGLHFLKGFWGPQSWVGEALGKGCQLEQLLCSLPGSHWALRPGSPLAVSTPPHRLSSSRGHRHDALHRWKLRSNSAGRAKYKFLAVLLAWARMGNLCLPNDASGCECPFETKTGMQNINNYLPGAWATIKRTGKKK